MYFTVKFLCGRYLPSDQDRPRLALSPSVLRRDAVARYPGGAVSCSSNDCACV
jgi:hypothetical protein